MAATELQDYRNQFDSAVKIINNLPRNGTFQPSAELKLRFYAYFKQATIGRCNEPKPAFWDVVKRAKWDAWNALNEMPKHEARLKYVDTLRQVIETMSYSDDVQKFLVQLNDGEDDLTGNPEAVAEQTSTKFVDLNSTRQISLNGGIRPADVVSSEEDVFSDATADVQAESTSRLSEDIHRIKVLEADFTLNDKMSTTVNHSIATVPAENHQDTPKLNNQPNAQKESPPRIEKCKHRKLTFTKYADFKLSSEEKQILLRWNPKEKTPGKKKRKTRGLDDKNGGNAEPSSAYTDDLPDGGQSEDRSIIEVESHANSSHRSFGPNSSGSESTSHDDSFSSVEWDPRIGAVLMKMHNQLQQINRKMCSLQDTLLIQQQMLNQLINDKNHPKTYVITVISQQQKSAKSGVERVDDLDSLKKLLRTKNNVLILYSTGLKTGSHDLNEVSRLLASVSLSLYGKSTIISVDCLTENGRKICKKMKVAFENKPYILYHYNSGKFNKEYDRSLTEASLTRFLSDPTADTPWEEEKDAADVYHVPDAKAWYKSLKKQKLPILAMFYAPWCGYCKRLKPHYTAAAASLRSTAMLAALDVTRPELYELQKLYNITGFPTVLYFQEGELKFPFGGAQTKDGIVEWMKNPKAGSPNAGPVEEIVWSEEQNDVVHLQDDTFDAFVSKNPSVLVMFYAPWCGHCKAMKGDYAESAKLLKEQNADGILAAVDATKAKQLAEKFGITGFPSLKYFKDGKFAWDFNERSKEKLVEFMKDPQEPPPPPPPEKPWHEEETRVVHLVGDDFRSELKKRKHALVIFYAPWCGHCKTTKPEFAAAAEHFKDNSKVAFAAVDCTNEANQFICKSQDIKGFPTIRYFNYFKNTEDYLGGRLVSDFIGYIDAQVGPPAPVDEPISPPAEVPADEDVGYQQADEDDTSDPEPWGYVKMLTPENYRDVMNSVQRTLVMFFSPSCRYCEEVKPEFKAAAFRIKNRNDVALAALDCVQYLDACMDFRVAGYPSLFLFDKTNYVDIHHGKPTRENFVRTILAHLESEKGQPPSSTPPKSEL